MAGNLYWIYNIKARRWESGPHPTAGDANAALLRVVGKSGSRMNDKVDGGKGSDCEVITVTRP